MKVLHSGSGIFRGAGGHPGRVGGFFTLSGHDNKVFGMSNNHVIANMGNCSQGDIVCLYTPMQEVIGQLFKWYKLQLPPVVNRHDLAFFEVDGNYRVAWNMPGNRINPTGQRDPEKGDEVYMNIHDDEHSCSSSRYTPTREGRIVGERTGTMVLPLDNVNINYTKLYVIHSTNGCPFSYPGDSGTMVFGSDHKALGILVGGYKKPNESGAYIAFMAKLPWSFLNKNGIYLYYDS